jgi:hypothetical protein
LYLHPRHHQFPQQEYHSVSGWVGLFILLDVVFCSTDRSYFPSFRERAVAKGSADDQTAGDADYQIDGWCGVASKWRPLANRHNHKIIEEIRN